MHVFFEPSGLLRGEPSILQLKPLVQNTVNVTNKGTLGESCLW